MYLDYSEITQDLDNYVDVLTDPNSEYCVQNREKALRLKNDLLNAILDIGKNYKYGTQVCPFTNLGQEIGEDGFAAIRNLRMKRYKKWIIVFIVDEESELIKVTKLVHSGYPLGDSIDLRAGDGLTYSLEGISQKAPIIECLRWMLKLGCMNEDQIKSASRRLLQ